MTGLRFLRATLTMAAGVLLACGTAQARQRPLTVTVRPSAYDRYQAGEAQRVMRHVMPANTAAARAALQAKQFDVQPGNAGAQWPAPSLSPSTPGATDRDPADLQYHGGSVVQSAVQYLIYVNVNRNRACNTVARCWGDPVRFLHDLDHSDFIHVVDPYVGETDGDRYRVSQDLIYVDDRATGRPYTDADIQTIVHAVVAALGLPTGYQSIYDVFLPPGQDVCSGRPFTSCYSPDRPSVFAFCAYHSSADFRDIGHVLYTVEPFQDVAGCASRPNGPNGPLVDSTNNTLSHETIETITDPDGTAWWNELNNALFQDEIADECSFLVFSPPPPALPGPQSSVYFDPSTVELNGVPYLVQPEYANATHRCTTAPGGD